MSRYQVMAGQNGQHSQKLGEKNSKFSIIAIVSYRRCMILPVLCFVYHVVPSEHKLTDIMRRNHMCRQHGLAMVKETTYINEARQNLFQLWYHQHQIHSQQQHNNNIKTKQKQDVFLYLSYLLLSPRWRLQLRTPSETFFWGQWEEPYNCYSYCLMGN